MSGTDLAVIEEGQAVVLGSLDNSTPANLIDTGKAMAEPLARLIKEKQLFTTISKKEYVRIEGWTTLLAMLGVTPQEAAVVEDGERYIATVELVRITDGQVVGRASAECGRSEKMWANRDAYAIRSMALTRATGKAARLAFSWIMTLGGFEGTPAEEMIGTEAAHRTPDEGPGQQPRNKSSEFGPTKVPFGKDKGTPLVDCDTPYLEKLMAWCKSKQDDDNPDKFQDLIDSCQDIVDARAGSANEDGPGY